MLLEMLSAAQNQSSMDGGGDCTSMGGEGDDSNDNNNNNDESDNSANDDNDDYNVYDALRKEERNRNSMMRFKIQR